MSEKFPLGLNNGNNFPEKKVGKNKEALEPEEDLRFHYEMLVGRVKNGGFVTPTEISIIQHCIERAKKAAVDTSKIEAEIPGLTKKVWRLFVPQWIEEINKPFINKSDFEFTIETTIRKIINGLKETPRDLLDAEMLGLLRDLAIAVDAVIQKSKKIYNVSGAEREYSKFIQMIQTNTPPLKE